MSHVTTTVMGDGIVMSHMWIRHVTYASEPKNNNECR